MSDYDLLVRDGTIADRLGNDLFEGDVATRDGKIVAVSTIAESTGKDGIVAPGRFLRISVQPNRCPIGGLRRHPEISGDFHVA